MVIPFDGKVDRLAEQRRNRCRPDAALDGVLDGLLHLRIVDDLDRAAEDVCDRG